MAMLVYVLEMLFIRFVFKAYQDLQNDREHATEVVKQWKKLRY